MNIEQKPGVNPEYPRTIADIIEATGMPKGKNSNGILRRKIDGDARLTPLTNSDDGRIAFSEADFQLVVKERKENISSRTHLESAILPDGSRITAKKTFHIQQITEIVTKAREKQQAFSLEQIVNALDPTYRESYRNKTTRKKALVAIRSYRRKIELYGWLIDSIIPREDAQGQENPQFWFRRKDEPPFTPSPDTEALAKKEITLLNGERITVEKNTLPMKIIREATLAQQNKRHYLDSDIVALMDSPFKSTNESRVGFAINRANLVLGKYGLRLIPYEIEIEGKKIRAYKVTEIKQQKPTSSLEQKSLTG